jgi:hypothetical protein
MGPPFNSMILKLDVSLGAIYLHLVLQKYNIHFHDLTLVGSLSALKQPYPYRVSFSKSRCPSIPIFITLFYPIDLTTHKTILILVYTTNFYWYMKTQTSKYRVHILLFYDL